MDIVLRASVTFAALYLLLRLLGKREIGQLTPFELVVIVVMGDLVQQGVTHNDFSLTGSILAIATFAFWALVMSWATYLSPRLETLLDGRPLPALPSVAERFAVALRHARLAVEIQGDDRQTTIEFRKHLGWYVKGLPGASDLRRVLHQVEAMSDVERIFDEYRAPLAAAG